MGDSKTMTRKRSAAPGTRGAPAADGLDVPRALELLNGILETELAGTVRYMHYSFMVFGHNRIPITSWLRAQATESLAHATAAGEHITSLGGHPSLEIGELLETHKHSVDQILSEAREHESVGLTHYRDLLEVTR